MKKLGTKQKLVGFIAILIIAVILAIIITTNVVKNIGAVGEGYASTANAGSTLVANYIKNGITIGGVTGTLESLDTSDATATAEDIAWGKTAYVKGEKITGTYLTLTLGDIDIGDYVDYKPDNASPYKLTSETTGSSSNSESVVQEELNWRVLSKNDDGTVDLISDRSTEQTIYFQGAIGYNNAVYLLNDLAQELYSNNNLNGSARSINSDDLEIHMTDEGLENIHSYTPYGGVKWGQTKTYTLGLYYPRLYEYENGSGIDLENINDPNTETKLDGISQSSGYYDSPTQETYRYGTKSLTVKQTYYESSMNMGYYDNSVFYNLIHSGEAYWLASRYVNTYTNFAYFGLRYVDNTKLAGQYLFISTYGPGDDNYHLRPIVSLSSNLKLSTGDGKSPSTAYKIEY